MSSSAVHLMVFRANKVQFSLSVRIITRRSMVIGVSGTSGVFGTDEIQR